MIRWKEEELDFGGEFGSEEKFFLLSWSWVRGLLEALHYLGPHFGLTPCLAQVLEEGLDRPTYQANKE